jgi:hypothetical protein
MEAEAIGMKTLRRRRRRRRRRSTCICKRRPKQRHKLPTRDQTHNMMCIY